MTSVKEGNQEKDNRYVKPVLPKVMSKKKLVLIWFLVGGFILTIGILEYKLQMQYVAMNNEIKDITKQVEQNIKTEKEINKMEDQMQVTMDKIIMESLQK